MREEKECPVGMIRFVRRPRWLLVFILIVGGLLTSCASDWRIEHGIHLEIKGTVPVYGIQVIYGEKLIEIAGKAAPGGGSGYTAPMVVPEVMTVRWTVEGQRQEVSIPLKNKLDPAHPLENWILIFNAYHLELIRQVLLEPPTTLLSLRSRGETKVYP